MIALQGQYEPFLEEVQGDRRRLDAATSFDGWSSNKAEERV
jgi:hypothetical protein